MGKKQEQEEIGEDRGEKGSKKGERCIRRKRERGRIPRDDETFSLLARIRNCWDEKKRERTEKRRGKRKGKGRGRREGRE